jgi:hypothetical protein
MGALVTGRQAAPSFRTSLVSATLLAAVLVTACTSTGETPSAQTPSAQTPSASGTARDTTMTSRHPYVGMWVTADHHIRQELLPDGRYDEARGTRESAYTGRYWVTGSRIEYRDDTGFFADGTFDGDVLHHGGYVFYREGSAAHREAVRIEAH